MRDNRIQSWLRLEAGASEDGASRDAAESAFSRLIQLLPVHAPGADFAAAVVTRLGLQPVAVPSLALWRARLGPWGLRAAAVWGIVQTGLVIALWTSIVRGLSLSLGPIRLLAGIGSGVARGLDWAVESLGVALRVAELSQASVASAGPIGVFVLLACIGASAVGLALMAPRVAPTGEATGVLH